MNISYKLDELDLFDKRLRTQAILIKYEVVTPDLMLLCFRATRADGEEQFYALLEYDHLYSIKHARQVIAKHFAKPLEFVQPLRKQKGRTELEQKSAPDRQNCNAFLLARTARPTGDGYWASYVRIKPGDDLKKKIGSLPAVDRPMALKVLNQLLHQYPPKGSKPAHEDFIGSWMAKMERERTPDELKTNDTSLDITAFKNSIGNWETFFWLDKSDKS